ncbi:sugar-binding transcriptional regulator [Lactobacillus corticis]|uniref:Citrate lyase regulator n=1 Tax=Lactobacillus corticis TaxID=2201249 RepID=A0A916QHI1_9LACO|nr:sugar-binding domain-containing protein [Lactobacillus corticis]GFZ27069.1 citrate lyase regulator [Lactobacillus corticis]
MAQLTDDQLASIAQDYYFSKLNIAEISQKYDLSRYLIAKALEDAQAKGIVEINIRQNAKRDTALETQLLQKFHLTEAAVLKTGDDVQQDMDLIPEFAAKEIQTYLKNVTNVGVTWGSLMMTIIKNFAPEERPDLTFVQMIGQGINAHKRKNPLVQSAADRFNAQSRALPAPIYVLNPETLRALEKEPFYERISSYYDKLDLLFTSLGTFKSYHTNEFLKDYYESTMFKNIPQEKIAGMIFGRPYDINGNFFPGFDDNICGMNLDQIRSVPIRFGIVRNRFKSEALLGALRSGIITHLVTSDRIAMRVMTSAKE